MKIYKNPTLILFALFYLADPCFAQELKTEEYLFQIVNRTMDTEMAESYVGLVNNFKSLENRVIPLTNAEGAKNYTVDVFVPIKFAIFQQRERNILRNQGKYSKFFTYSRLYLDYGFHIRVPKGVDSSPILPPTNRFGIRFDKMFNLREDGELLNRKLKIKKETQSIDVVNPDKTYSYHNLSFYIHHYSNGQGAGSILDTLLKRNDYLQGDFSTNFIRGSWGYHRYKPNKYHLGIYAGFQREVGNDEGFLSFRAAQENRYGKNRIMAGALFNRAIKLGAINWFPEQINLRMDLEWILDKKENLFDYPYENKHRFAFHVFMDLPIKQLKAVGILVHYFRGRDFLNIRYDDPVSLFQLGISLKIQRFTVKYGDGEGNI